MAEVTKGKGGEEMIAVGEGAAMFTHEELKDMCGVRKGPNYVEVLCGCTRRGYGDSIGKLRIFADGRLEVECDCIGGCAKGKTTPEEFLKHCEKQMPESWPCQIWVNVGGRKVRLWRTALLKYYKEAQKYEDKKTSSSKRKRNRFHRDDFVKCSQCGLERRFHLRSQQECRIFHDAKANSNWSCSYLGLQCKVEIERHSRKNIRGCPRETKCEGCITCVCFGCHMCRFSDCQCRTCLDFCNNA